MVVGWSLLASVTLGHVVYYRPLPTDCPDTALTDSLLRHNDSFLYAQHLTGHFPDIKRQAAGSGSGGPRHWIKSSDTHSPPSSPGSDPTHAVSSRPSGNAGKLAAARTAPLGPRAASRSPKGKAEDGELGTAVINARRSPGVKAANSDLSQTDTRPGTDRSHGDQLNWSGNRGRVEVDRGRVEEDRGRVEEDRDRSGTRNDRLPAQTDTKYRTKSEGPWSAGQRTPSSDSGSETPHDVLEGSGASSRFPDPRVRLSSAQRGKLLNYLQSVSVLLGSNGDDLPPPDTATATATANGTARWASRALHSLFHCFGAGPSHLVLLSHGAATSSGRPQRTHEDQGHGGNEERGLLVEDSTTLADADEKRASHQREELADVQSVLLLADLVSGPKHSALTALLRWDPMMTKRLSFVHPTCLNGKLDYAKTAPGTDANIVQLVKQLTDLFPFPADSDAEEGGEGRREVLQHQDVQRQDTRRYAGLTVARGGPTERPAQRQEADLAELSATGSFRPSNDRPLWKGQARELAGSQSEETLAATHSGHPQRTLEDQRHGRNEERGLLVEDSTTLADADEKKRASHQRQELDEGWGSVGQSERRVARSVAVTKRPKWTQALARGAPLPWVCASSTKWRDLGLHVFPRYVQETSCGEDSSGDNHENATCWFGFYNCRPSTSSVQVLVRHTGSCNDSRVPQNMRRHYFLSIISVSTGCICR